MSKRVLRLKALMRLPQVISKFHQPLLHILPLLNTSRVLRVHQIHKVIEEVGLHLIVAPRRSRVQDDLAHHAEVEPPRVLSNLFTVELGKLFVIFAQCSENVLVGDAACDVQIGEFELFELIVLFEEEL